MEAKPFPLDFDKLKPGDFITPEEIESIVEHRRELTAYMLGRLKLQARVERELERRGCPVYARGHRGGILLVAGVAGAENAHRQFQNAMIRAARHHRKGIEIAANADLTEEERSRIDRQTFVRASLLQAMARERRRLKGRRKEIDGPN